MPSVTLAGTLLPALAQRAALGNRDGVHGELLEFGHEASAGSS